MANEDRHAAIDPRSFAQAPELAALAILEMTLEITARALIAEHPTLIDHERPPCGAEPVTLREARRLLERIKPLEKALGRYRDAVLVLLRPPEPVTDDDFPF